MPWCSSTRAEIHKGLFPLRVDPDGSGIGIAITDEDTEWGLDNVTHTDLLPQLLQGAGYETGIFGKWHLGTGYADPDFRDLAPSRAGYDHAEVVLRRHNPAPFHYFNYNVTLTDGSDENRTEYHTTNTLNQAKTWINGQTGPWFAWVALLAAHEPWECPPANLIDNANCFAEQQEEIRYRFIIQALDKELGRFLDEIDWDDTLKNNTVLFILSDNGSPEEVAHDPVNPDRAKATVGQGGVRVPFWIGGKDVSPGVVLEGKLATVADIYATILGLAGVSIPQDHLDEYPDDSKTLTPFFSNPQATVRPWAFTQAFTPNKDPGGNTPLVTGEMAVRLERYKCVRTLGGQEAFYDLQEDPWEGENLLQTTLTSAELAKRAECKAILADILGNCTLAKQGEACLVNSDCCTGVCQGSPGNKVCTDLL